MRKLTGLRITGYTLLNNSRMGNPRFAVRFDNAETYITESDNSLAYEIRNFTHSKYENRTFTIELGRWNRITRMELEEEKFQRGEVVNGMTILEINAQGLFLAKWDDGAEVFYSVARVNGNGIEHIKDFSDGYDATKHYVLLGGTIA